MNHTITVGGLLAAFSGILALICLAAGVLAIFASGMSDAPEAGNDATHIGCICLIIGAAALAISIWLVA